MAADPEAVRKAAIAELARRELERRAQPENNAPVSLPSFTGEGPPVNPYAHMMLPPKVLAESAKGIGEAGLALGTGTVATPVAGLHGIGASIMPGGRTGAEAVRDTASALTYQPRTDAGQIASGVVGFIPGKIGEATSAAGGVVADATGSPALGAAIKTVGDIAPALAFRGRTQAPKTAVKALPRKPPTTEQLKAQATQAYQAAEDAGVIISGKSLSGAVERIVDRVANEGIDATLHPDSMAALNRLMDAAGKNHSLKGADILRQVIKDAEASTRPADRRMAGIMRREFDDYMENLGPDDVIAGDAQAATQALSEARNLYSRNRKAETVENLMKRAEIRASQFSGSGYENALRTEFRQLAMNEKKMRRFSPEEQAAIKRVAQGGPIENTMRMLGKFAPTGAVSAAISGGAGAAMFGPLGAVGLPLAGGIARQAAAALTRGNARSAAELMRRGGAAQTSARGAGRAALASTLAELERR